MPAEGGIPYAELREQLIARVKADDKPFGLIFDDISGGFTLTGRGTPNSYAVQPVTVWRVWPDGRPDELVRGVDLIGTPLVTFGRIVGASDTTDVFNGTCGAESGWVPVSGIAPDLLISEVEVQRREKNNDRPPLLSPPTVHTLPSRPEAPHEPAHRPAVRVLASRHRAGVQPGAPPPDGALVAAAERG